MARRPRKNSRSRAVRSADQRDWNTALGLASKAWETLSDLQFRTWNIAGKSRRSSGQRYFVSVNAPRIRDRQELLKLPPPQATYCGGRILKQFFIRNRGGRITLVLVLSRVPAVRMTVWGSRPCNRGVSAGIKCPRLGDLPRQTGGVCEITWLYYRKHWDYIEKHDVEMVGKRIFIRLRVELPGWGKLYEALAAVVPPPEDRRARAKSG